MAPLPRLNRRVLPHDRDRDVQQALRWVGRASETVGDFVVDRSEARHGVLVAPSGAGKTTELQQACDAHREAGRPVAFVRANEVTGDAPAEITDIAGAPFVLVVDAIDELSMDGMTFGSMLKALSAWCPEPHLARLVFSARSGRWNPTHEAALLRSPFATASGPAEEWPTERLVSVRTFCRLELADAIVLASAWGLSDQERELFGAAFYASGIDVPLRPCDVQVLVAGWHRNRSLPPSSELVESFVGRAFPEQDDVRQRQLTPQRERQGIERLAATRLLTQKSFLAHPHEAVGEDSIDPHALFEDWRDSEVSELLEHPVLEPKGRDGRAVQLPDGWVAPYLAASWCHERFAGGLPVGDFLERLSVRIAGEQVRFVPPVWHAFLGWMATVDRDVRERLLPEFPEIVLFEGDPRALTDDDVREGLEMLLRNRVRRGRPSGPSLRALMRPSLVGFVSTRMDVETDALRLELLLDLAEAGDVPVAPFADKLLEHPSVFARSMAVRLLGQQARNRADADFGWVQTAKEDASVRVWGRLLAYLPSKILGPQDVLQLLRRKGDDATPYRMIAWARAEDSDTRRVFAELVRPLAEDSKDAARVLFGVVVDLLDDGDGSPDEFLFPLVNAAEVACARHDFFITDEDFSKARECLRPRTGLRQRLLVDRYAQRGHHSRYQRRSHPAFGAAQLDDLPLLLTRQAEWDEEDAYWAAEAGISIFLRHEAEQSALQQQFPELAPQFEDALARKEQQRLRSAAYDEGKRIEKEAERAKDSAILRSSIERLRSGDDIHNLSVIASRANLWDKEPSKLSLGIAEAQLEPDVFAAVEEGFRNSWRKVPPKPPEPGRILLSQQVALVGFQLDLRDGFKLDSLDEQDVVRVTTFALSSLNRLPQFLEPLAERHPVPVCEVLAKAIDGDWEHPSDVHGAFRLMADVRPNLAALAKELVLTRLAKGPPANVATLRYAVDVVLTSKTDAARALAAVPAEKTGPAGAQWWRLLANLAPLRAVDELEAVLEDDEQAGEEVLEALANDLEVRSARPFMELEGEALVRWWALALRYAPGPRDDEPGRLNVVPPQTLFMEAVREAIARSASPATREALKEFRSRAKPEWHGQLDWLLERQLGTMVDAGRPVWTEADVLKLEAGDGEQA